MGLTFPLVLVKLVVTNLVCLNVINRQFVQSPFSFCLPFLEAFHQMPGYGIMIERAGGISNRRDILWVWPESDVRKQQLQFVSTDLFLFDKYLNLDFFASPFATFNNLLHHLTVY